MLKASHPKPTTQTFLLVDDHAGFRRTVRDFLPGDAGEIIECSDGAEAVQVHADHRPDWTLMDVDMPIMDGLAATRAILADDPQARVVIVTGNDTADCREEAFQAGATAFVPKANLCLLVELFASR